MAYNADLGAPGSVNSAGSRTALFLKVFAGEVLATFEEANVMKALHTIRTISSGKSAQFIVTGAASSRYHTPGEVCLTIPIWVIPLAMKLTQVVILMTSICRRFLTMSE